MTCDEVKTLIEQGIEGAVASVSDLTGTGDHFTATVVAAAFEGKQALEMHRMVYVALGDAMNGPIHALQLNTRAQ